MSLNAYKPKALIFLSGLCLVFSLSGLSANPITDTASIFDQIDALVSRDAISFSEGWSGKAALITGDRPLPSFTVKERFPCGTGILLKLRKEWRNLPQNTKAEMLTRLTPPTLVGEQTHVTADGNFRIHYTLHSGSLNAVSSEDRNGNNLPDVIDALEMSLIHCWSVEVLEMGWGTDEEERHTPLTGIFDVFVAGRTSAVNGYTFFKNMNKPFTGLDSLYMVIAPGVVEKEELMQVTAAHLLSHALQFFYSKRLEVWWSEGVATWMESKVYDDIPRYRSFLNLSLRHPEKSLTTDHGLAPFSSCLWAFFLSDRFGDRLILDIFKRYRIYSYETVLNLTDRELLEKWDSNIISAFREFTIWNFFTKRKDDRKYYRQSAAWDWIQPSREHEIFPVETISGENPLGSFGAAYFRFLPDGSRGGIILSLCSLEPAHIIGDIITVSNSHPQEFDVIPVGGSIKEGKLDIGMPWHNFSEIILVIQRVDQLYPEGVQLTYSAFYNPSIPVEFSAFVVNSNTGENTLIWTTEKENHNFGYLVYRSSETSEGFTNINTAVIPAIGDSSNRTSYMYIDSDIEPGKKYHYFVRAFTLEGIHFDSYILSTTAR